MLENGKKATARNVWPLNKTLAQATHLARASIQTIAPAEYPGAQRQGVSKPSVQAQRRLSTLRQGVSKPSIQAQRRLSALAYRSQAFRRSAG